MSVLSLSIQAEDQGYVILGRRSTSSSWYYLTSVNANTEYTPHLEAVNSGVTDRSKISTFGLEEKYIWHIEDTTGGFLLRNNDKYVSYFGVNTMGMSDTGQVLYSTAVVGDLVNYWFWDNNDNIRYLSLNTTHDYFSFYTGTQAQNLLVLKYGALPKIDCKNLPYSETFESSQGDFTVLNVTLPSGFTSIWNWDSQYGMVAKCIKGSTKYASESWLISPCIELPTEGKSVITFSHAAKFFENTSQMTLWISTDFNDSNPSGAKWDCLAIPNYPTGSNWDWYESGEIDLSAYKGQSVNIAFCYKSTTSYAPQWEIKNFSVKESPTSVENAFLEQPTTTKFVRDNQVLILRGEKTYTVTGQEVK